MADPVSISGLILAVLGSVGRISSFIGEVRNVPYQIRFLRSDLEALKPTLDQLDEVISRPGQREIPVARHLFPALEQCQEAALLFEKSLKRWTDGGKIAWTDKVVIAIRHQSQIDAFQKQLAACKQSLILSITATHLSQSKPEAPLPAENYYWNELEVLERNATEMGNLFSTDTTRMDDQIRSLTLCQPAENDIPSQHLTDSAIRQLQLYKAAAEHFHKLCSESIPKTVTEVKQRIRNVKTSEYGVAHVGSFNEREGEKKINLDISDVTTENRGFAIVGRANGIDFNQMFKDMYLGKKV